MKIIRHMARGTLNILLLFLVLSVIMLAFTYPVILYSIFESDLCLLGYIPHILLGIYIFGDA